MQTYNNDLIIITSLFIQFNTTSLIVDEFVCHHDTIWFCMILTKLIIVLLIYLEKKDFITTRQSQVPKEIEWSFNWEQLPANQKWWCVGGSWEERNEAELLVQAQAAPTYHAS